MSIEQAVKASIEANPEVGAQQGGFVALALAYAQRMDEAAFEGGPDAVKAMYLGPHLASIMEKNLGLSLAPSEKASGTTAPGRGPGTVTPPSKLAALRAARPGASA